MQVDVEETMKRLQAQKGVTGVIVMDSVGRAIRSTMTDEATAQHCALFQQLNEKTRSVVQEIDANNDVRFHRIRTKKNEYMVVPGKDYSMVVVENLAAGAS